MELKSEETAPELELLISETSDLVESVKQPAPGPAPLGRLARFLSRLPIIGRIFKRRREKEIISYSKFKDFFAELDHNDPIYPLVFKTTNLCDDALRIASQRVRLGSRLQDYYEKLTELAAFASMTEDEVIRLRKMLQYFMSLASERSQLYNKMEDYDRSLVEMYKLEDDARAVLPDFKEVEEKHRAIKQELNELNGTKSELVYERENMERGVNLVRYFSVGLVISLVGIVLALGGAYIFGGVNIIAPSFVVGLMGIVLATLLRVLRMRLIFELRMNFKKQMSITLIINKKSVVFAYYANFLRFVNKKYKTRNSTQLERTLENFEKYKILLAQIDNVRRAMYQTEEEIERVVREKRISGLRSTIEDFARAVNLEDKKRYYDELLKSKNAIEAELSALDAQHEKIWEELLSINDSDVSSGRIIDKIIQTYLNEAGSLMSNF